MDRGVEKAGAALDRGGRSECPVCQAEPACESRS